LDYSFTISHLYYKQIVINSHKFKLNLEVFSPTSRLNQEPTRLLQDCCEPLS